MASFRFAYHLMEMNWIDCKETHKLWLGACIHHLSYRAINSNICDKSRDDCFVEASLGSIWRLPKIIFKAGKQIIIGQWRVLLLLLLSLSLSLLLQTWHPKVLVQLLQKLVPVWSMRSPWPVTKCETHQGHGIPVWSYYVDRFADQTCITVLIFNRTCTLGIEQGQILQPSGWTSPNSMSTIIECRQKSL